MGELFSCVGSRGLATHAMIFAALRNALRAMCRIEWTEPQTT
jgi:hypothetical protein